LFAADLILHNLEAFVRSLLAVCTGAFRVQHLSNNPCSRGRSPQHHFLNDDSSHIDSTMKGFGIASAAAATIAASSFVVSAVAADLPSIVIKGSKFFYENNGTQL
jgi:hypothetical protein